MRKSGYVFTPYEAPEQSPFERLFDIFSELITHTSGDVDEALEWLAVLDKEYTLTNEDYTMEDFIEDLKKKGYLREEIQPDGNGQLSITAKTERILRKNALEQIFGRIRKSGHCLLYTSPSPRD
jgi:Ca-activated chloride channel family protein